MNNYTGIRKTPLYNLHVELGGKIVDFAGYQMPLHYTAGILREHLHTRERAGLFDVSHMGQFLVEGTHAAAELETLLPVDLQGLAGNRQVYALLTQDDGGIQDDLIVTRLSATSFLLVVNAACKSRDLLYLRRHLPALDIRLLSERALLALQGPAAVEVLAPLVPEAAELVFMHGCRGRIDGQDCFITRSGYTGEDGFELSIPAGGVEKIARYLLRHPAVAPIGLGARDSLRLEAGLCLYGQDMDANTTPVEASLAWSISPVRRSGGARAGGFPGAARIFKQQADGVERRRVGLLPTGRAPVRPGADLVADGGAVVGRVTSGGYGPSVGGPVAMGYVPAALARPGTGLHALVRGKPLPVTVAKLPFVPQRYYRG